MSHNATGIYHAEDVGSHVAPADIESSFYLRFFVLRDSGQTIGRNSLSAVCQNIFVPV